MLEIDGSYLSGGGQILRSALALSVLGNKAFRIVNIRKGRDKPGLKEQHLQVVRAVKELCNAEVKGDELGSGELVFIPNKVSKDKLKVNINGAGSTALVLQSLLIIGSRYDLKIEINGGGTWNKWAPSICYLQNVLVPILNKIDYKLEIKVFREGFYPKGGAKLIVKTEKCDLKPLNLDKKSKLLSINCFSIASNSLRDRKVAERQSKEAKHLLDDYKVKVENNYVDTLDYGSGILLVAKYENCIIGYDNLGEKSKKAEDVAIECCKGFLKQVNNDCTVDEFMSDQILPYLALCNGKSVIKINELTEHAKTNIWLIKHFLDVNFEIKDNFIYVENLNK